MDALLVNNPRYFAEFRARMDAELNALRLTFGRERGLSPVCDAMRQRYIELWEHLLANPDDYGKVAEQIDGLQKRLFKDGDRNVALEELSDMMRSVGYSPAQRVLLKESLPKGRAGAKPERELNIMSLDLHIEGYSDCEIADMLCSSEWCKPHRNDATKENDHAAKFRKRWQALRDFLEKDCGFAFSPIRK
jgi:hypothetical protein